MATETCRDVLAELLARTDQWGGAGSLTGCGITPDRLRAAIAADDAERERLRGIEAAALRFTAEYGVACLHGPWPDLGSESGSDAAVALFESLPPLMRKLAAAQVLAHPDGCHSTDRNYTLTGGCGGDGHYTCKTCTQYDPDERIVWAKDSDADAGRDDG